jgi:iron complex outermembrane receptor protein
MALLDAARANGTRLFGGESTLKAIDGAISGEIWQLPAGPVAVAAGFDYRKESYKFDDGSRTSQPVYQAPFDPEFAKVERTVKAIYGEIAIPLFKGFEVTAAVRRDDYSDFGSTTNPKASFRWQPIQNLVFRGSYGEGFRAPSFFQLYTSVLESPVPGNIADPELCPNGNVPGADLTVCAIRPNARTGGNASLQPETSKQSSVGFVWEPTNWASASMDFWKIERDDRIYELTAQQVVANYQTFPGSLVRGTNGRLDGPGGYIQAGFVNASGDVTKGIDVSLRFNWQGLGGRWTATLDGTYIDEFKSRLFDSQPYVDTVGKWNARDLFVKWKHTAALSYDRGPWSATFWQQYTDGYEDEKPLGVANVPGFNPNVDEYIIYGITGTYTGFKNWTITAGIKNLFNEDPPFTAHNLDFAAGAGWDPRVADPRGRSYVARVTYRF